MTLSIIITRLGARALYVLAQALCLSVAFTPAPAARAQSPGAIRRPELVLQTGYPMGGPNGLAYSGDGKLLATIKFDSNQIKLWDMAAGRELRTLAIAGGAGSGFLQILTGVSAVAFSRDGRLLAAGGRDNAITVWDTKTGRTVQTLHGPTDTLLAGIGVLALAFSADGRQLVSFGDATRTWDLTSGQATRETPLDQAASDNVGAFNGALALSTDGSQLAMLANSNKGTRRAVKLYELTTGRELRTINPPDDFPAYGLAVLALTPDGRTLCAALDEVASGQPKLKLYDLSAHGRGQTLTPVARTASIFRFSTDGRWLALADGQNVRVWETATGTERQSFKVDKPAWLATQPEFIGALTFSPDGKFLTASAYGGPINVWEVETGRATQKLEGHSNFAFGVAFSADGTRLVSGGRTVWDLTTGRGLRTAQATEPFGLVSRDGRLLAALTNADSRVTLYDTTTQRRLFTLAPETTPPTLKAVAPGASTAPNFIVLPPVFSPDGRLLATTYRPENYAPSKDEQQQDTKAMQKAGQAAMKQAMKNPGAYQQIYQAELAKLNGARGATLANQIKVWDTQTGREAHTITVPGGNGLIPTLIQHVTFSEDGKQVAVVQFNNPTVTVWDVNTGAQVHTIGAQPAPGGGFPSGATDNADPFAMLGGGGAMFGGGATISAVAFSPDGRLLATGGLERTGGGLDMSALMSQMGALGRNPKAKVDPAAMQKQLLQQMQQSMKTTGMLKLYDAQTGREVRAFTGHTGEVQAVAFSPDGRLLASAAADNAIKLWDAQTGRELFTLTGHTAQINSLAFSPDTRLLASAGNDGSTLLWDTHEGRQLATLVSLYDGGEWLVATPDGLFDGSPLAWDQVLWRYDEDTFNVAPIEWFFNEFFSPSLLAEIAAGKRPHARADFADKDRRQPQLAITLAEPAGADAPITTRNVKVRIEVRDAKPDDKHNAGSGALDLRLFRNGSLVKAWRGDVLKGQASVTLEATLPLVAGQNRLAAYAFNRDNVKSRNATLALTGAETLKRTGTAYVLAVGINQYANQQYNLKYAVPDAREFGAEVERQQGKLGRYDHVQVTTLIDQQATKANIMAALAKLAADTQPEDEVVVYFAGHGTAHENQFYLIPHDLGYTGSRTQLNEAGLSSILAHSISDRELEAAFEQVNAAQLMFVIDACNSGQALEAEEKRRGPMNSKGLAQLAYEKGMYILTAAQSFQAAQEAATVGHGLLTYALVEEGLKQAKADNEPKDGAVLAREWFDYAEQRVPAMQVEKVKQARDLGVNISFVESEERGLDFAKRVAQRPRVFYRRELEAQPLVVAQPGKP
jgi:WD40 repeat protein